MRGCTADWDKGTGFFNNLDQEQDINIETKGVQFLVTSLLLLSGTFPSLDWACFL